MNSVSEQDPLNPRDPEFYVPRGLRERSKSRSSLSQGARSEPVRSPISLPASLDPEEIHEPAGLARELDRRGPMFSVAARVATAAGVVTVVALLFIIMMPASRQSNTGSTSSEITGSMRTALPQSGQADDGSKPALAEFRGILATAPASQPATQEQPQQLLQQFLQWRQKNNSTETSQ